MDDAGEVRMHAATPPPAGVVADLRQHRQAVVALLRERRRAAFYLRAMAEAAAALAVPDPDLDSKRAPVAAEHGDPLPTKDHQRHLAGLRAAAMQRPPVWIDQTTPPPPDCWCSCCHGRRWWAPERPVDDCTGIGLGWRCRACHPPPLGAATMEVQT
jgi:hypothetical protein